MKENQVLMKFGAEWCKPCAILDKTIELFLEKHKLTEGEEVQLFDADAHHDVFKDFNVRNVPTLILIEDGVEIKRTTGSLSLPALEMFVGIK